MGVFDPLFTNLLTDLLTTYSEWMGVLCVVRLGTDGTKRSDDDTVQLIID